MKKHLLIVLTILASSLAFTSCSYKSAATPDFEAWSKAVRTTAEGQRDTILISDTLNVGDTLRWYVLISGGVCYNSLTSFTLQTDTSALSVAIEPVDSTLANYLTTGTDLEHGKMVFKPAQLYACTLWLKFITRKSGSHPVEMTIANDAGVDFSPRTWTYTPVVK